MAHDRVLYLLTQVLWYLLYVVETFLILRFLLKLFGANAAAPFTDVIYVVSAGLLAPLQYVFGIDNVAGSILEWSSLLAMFVYWLVAWGLIELISMNRSVTSLETKETKRSFRADISHPLG